MRTTVLVPLHASAPWLPVVAGTIERLAPHARLIVSDATGRDDTLSRLRARFGETDGIEWVGPRALEAGWVAHCNDLLDRATTDFVMWMPHDDEIDPEWLALGERALEDDPGAVLALGQLRSLERNDVGADDRDVPSRFVRDPSPAFAATDPHERARAALDACLRGDGSLLGMAFRGVFRRATGVPLPQTGPDGAWSDQLWAIAMLCVGSFAPTEAVYWKRWYDGSVHSGWADRRADPSFRAELLPEALAPLPAADRARVLQVAWADDAAALAARITDLEERRDAAEAVIRELDEWVRRLEQERTELDEALAASQARVRSLRRKLRSARATVVAQRRQYERSTSWRVTAPLRRAAALMPRPRRSR